MLDICSELGESEDKIKLLSNSRLFSELRSYEKDEEYTSLLPFKSSAFDKNKFKPASEAFLIDIVLEDRTESLLENLHFYSQINPEITEYYAALKECPGSGSNRSIENNIRDFQGEIENSILQDIYWMPIILSAQNNFTPILIASRKTSSLGMLFLFSSGLEDYEKVKEELIAGYIDKGFIITPYASSRYTASDNHIVLEKSMHKQVGQHQLYKPDDFSKDEYLILLDKLV